MADEDKKVVEGEASSAIVEAGEVSKWLTEQGFDHESLSPDHSNVEMIRVESEFLLPFCSVRARTMQAPVRSW